MSTQPNFQAYIQRVNEIDDDASVIGWCDYHSENLLDCYEQVKAEFDHLQPDFNPSSDLSNLFASVREMQADLQEQAEEYGATDLCESFQANLKAFLELLVSEISAPAAPTTPIKREETPEPPAAPVKRPRDNDVDADELLSVSKRLFAQREDVEVIDLTTDEDD
jgi:hypothetical protein